MNLVPDSILHIYVVVDRWHVLVFHWILMRSLRKQSWKMMVAITWTGSVTWGLSSCWQKNYVLEALLGAKPAAWATPNVMNVWQSKADDYSIVQCAMIYILEPGLQWCFERDGAYERFQELKLIFQANARIERYEVCNKFYSCRMEENSSVSEHILRMYGYHNHLTQLGVNLPDDSVIDRILQSLPPSYKSFVMNYNMLGMVRQLPSSSQC